MLILELWWVRGTVRSRVFGGKKICSREGKLGFGRRFMKCRRERAHTERSFKSGEEQGKGKTSQIEEAGLVIIAM